MTTPREIGVYPIVKNQDPEPGQQADDRELRMENELLKARLLCRLRRPLSSPITSALIVACLTHSVFSNRCSKLR